MECCYCNSNKSLIERDDHYENSNKSLIERDDHYENRKGLNMEDKNYHGDMKVKDLKEILNKLPDDMIIVIPVVDEDDVNRIYGFRKVRTAGILMDKGEAEAEREVLCINGAYEGQDIADQIYFSGRDVGVKEILYGETLYEGIETQIRFF